jgi:hypothetical protein
MYMIFYLHPNLTLKKGRTKEGIIGRAVFPAISCKTLPRLNKQCPYGPYCTLKYLRIPIFAKFMPILSQSYRLVWCSNLAVFIQRRHWFGPHRFRRINEIPYQDCYTWFGHYPHNLYHLHIHLRVPEAFTTTSRQSYGGEECFLFYFYHLTKGILLTEMSHFVFGGNPRRLSEMNNLFISHGNYTMVVSTARP